MPMTRLLAYVRGLESRFAVAFPDPRSDAGRSRDEVSLRKS